MWAAHAPLGRLLIGERSLAVAVPARLFGFQSLANATCRLIGCENHHRLLPGNQVP